jgi:phosphotransferase system enzyme I (PtsI)
LISSFAELEQALRHIEQAKQSLRAADLPFDADIAVGMMVEVPAAAILAEAFARKTDFLSIGTNDLIQYTLAVDRNDALVADLYDARHPAVLRLIAMTIAAATKLNKPVSVCGEMAADIHCVRLLLGMGLREFSLHPAKILAVKREIIRADVATLEGKVARILKTNEPERLQQLLGEIDLL